MTSFKLRELNCTEIFNRIMWRNHCTIRSPVSVLPSCQVQLVFGYLEIKVLPAGLVQQWECTLLPRHVDWMELASSLLWISANREKRAKSEQVSYRTEGAGSVIVVMIQAMSGCVCRGRGACSLGCCATVCYVFVLFLWNSVVVRCVLLCLKTITPDLA